MAWQVIYHSEVQEDLIALGRVEAKNILTIITNRIKQGEPNKIGKPLSGQLVGCRRIRSGNTRIIYHIDEKKGEVLIVAIGLRRDNEVYNVATKRK